MIWIFEHDEMQVRLETRYDNLSDEYVLITHGMDDGPRTERFKDPESFGARLNVLQGKFDADGWVCREPTFLRDGWKLG
jgi:hypothetical protein